jgi:hypothetical protein
MESPAAFTFRFIELIAAFTLFGYMIAEMRGRKKESRSTTPLFPLSLVFKLIKYDRLMTYLRTFPVTVPRPAGVLA